MNRRIFLGRFLGGVAAAAAATTAVGTAIAHVSSPDSGQTTPKAIPGVDPAKQWVTLKAQWMGDPLDHNLPLSWWASPHSAIWDNDDFAEAFKWYCGGQWDAKTLEARMNSGRISLTANFIKPIVDRAITVSLDRGEDTKMTQEEWKTVFVNVYRRNRDPQIHYNALKSIELEIKMAAMPKPVFVPSRLHDRDIAGNALLPLGYEPLRLPVDEPDPNRPALTHNRIPEFIRRVTDEQRIRSIAR